MSASTLGIRRKLIQYIPARLIATRLKVGRFYWPLIALLNLFNWNYWSHPRGDLAVKKGSGSRWCPDAHKKSTPSNR